MNKFRKQLVLDMPISNRSCSVRPHLFSTSFNLLELVLGGPNFIQGFKICQIAAYLISFKTLQIDKLRKIKTLDCDMQSVDQSVNRNLIIVSFD